MNANADDATPPNSDAAASAPQGDEGEAAPAKTVRRKRAVKAAEPADSAVAPEAADEAPKPARKRRTTKAEGESSVEATADAAPVGVAEAEAPVKVPRKRAKKAEATSDSEALPSMPVQAELPMVAPDSVPSFEKPAPERSQAAGEDGAGAAQEPAVGSEASSSDDSASTPGAAPSGNEEGASGERSSRRRNRRDRRRGRGETGGVEQGGDQPRSAAASADDGDDDEDTPAAEPTPNLPAADVGEVFQQVMSGEFDVDGETAEEPVPHKRVLLPEPDAPKLHKVLAQSGIGSRRDMEQAIIDGKVSVNGQTAHVGQRISFGDRVAIDGKPVKVRILPPPPRIIAYHKPVGEVVTNDDPQHRPTVFRRLPRLQQGKWQSVGRLDLNTEGLLLFTNSGELANQLMHPRFGVEREYAVRVLGKLDEDSKAELLEGVAVDGQTASFKSIEDGGGEGANHWYRVVITEGRNREVRKLFDEVGLTVSRLIRIRYGTVVLPRGLKRGVWVDLGQDDVRAIRQLAGGGQGQGQQQGRDDRGGRNNRNKRNDRNDRGGRADRNDRGPRPNNGPQRGNNRPQEPVRLDQGRDRDDRDFDGDVDEEIDHSRIPNPLEQTFDKRFVQNPRSAVGGRGFKSGAGGFGAGGSGHNPAGGKKGGPREPDPLQTSVGYIGADAFHRKGNRGGGRGGRGGGGGGGGFGGGGGGGGFGGNRRGR